MCAHPQSGCSDSLAELAELRRAQTLEPVCRPGGSPRPGSSPPAALQHRHCPAALTMPILSPHHSLAPHGSRDIMQVWPVTPLPEEELRGKWCPREGDSPGQWQGVRVVDRHQVAGAGLLGDTAGPQAGYTGQGACGKAWLARSTWPLALRSEAPCGCVGRTSQAMTGLSKVFERPWSNSWAGLSPRRALPSLKVEERHLCLCRWELAGVCVEVTMLSKGHTCASAWGHTCMHTPAWNDEDSYGNQGKPEWPPTN